MCTVSIAITAVNRQLALARLQAERQRRRATPSSGQSDNKRPISAANQNDAFGKMNKSACEPGRHYGTRAARTGLWREALQEIKTVKHQQQALKRDDEREHQTLLEAYGLDRYRARSQKNIVTRRERVDETNKVKSSRRRAAYTASNHRKRGKNGDNKPINSQQGTM